MSGGQWAYRLVGAAPARALAGCQREWKPLQAGFITQAALERRTGRPADACLLRLDQRGLVAREWRSGRRAVFRLVPLGRPEQAPPAALPPGRLRLASTVLVQTVDGRLGLEAPGGWARVELLDARLGALLPVLATGCTRARLKGQLAGEDDTLDAWLLTLRHAGVLADAGSHDWPAHEWWFHRQTRRGYRHELPAKQSWTLPGRASEPEGPRIPLERASAHLVDMSLAVALRARSSHVAQHERPLSLHALGSLLALSLAETQGPLGTRRPYPSGGRCYSLRPYLLVRACAGLEPGLYAYDAVAHQLVVRGAAGPLQAALLQAGGDTAQWPHAPQVLLVLCADLARVQQSYGGLAYSLILKEVGAVMQTLQLVATAHGLTCCPLGTGDERGFAQLAGLDPQAWPVVGELLLGAAEPRGGGN